MDNDPGAWLDKYIAEQAAYWERLGLSIDLINEVAEAIETYGDDYFEMDYNTTISVP